jgi:GMP synthase-like glutamine amidotransferase
MTDRPRALVIINAKTSGPKRLTAWLEEEGVEPVLVNGEDGLPEQLDGFAGLVMLGGGLMPDAYDTAPWLHAERTLAQQAIEQDAPTLGICLGGQLIADVAGGEVRENHGPPERGSVTITPTADGSADPVLRHLGSRAPMIQHHRDMITRLPESATLLATSELIENQAFRIGQHVRGLQFHPEASAENVRAWNAESLAELGVDHAALVVQATADDEANTAASRALVGAFAAEIRAAAQR